MILLLGTGAVRRVVAARPRQRQVWVSLLRCSGTTADRLATAAVGQPRSERKKPVRSRRPGPEQVVVSPRRRLTSSGPEPRGSLVSRASHFVQHQWTHFKETMYQYWVGTKLLWLDVQTASGIVHRLLTGRTLTRRERKQLTRTTADVFRVVPFAVFVIVPFLEFLLPVALYFFPGMLPSTFQDSTKREEKAKATLRARIALTGFLGDALSEIRADRGSDGDDDGGSKNGANAAPASAAELSEFVTKARAGEIGTEDVTRFARLFRDELTLDNLKRPQLVVLCKYMGLNPFGPDALLRFQLRNAVRELRADDRRIVYEGVDSLTRQEMQEACAERGMRAVGLTKLQYREQLEQWLELAANRQVPIALLIMSRAFTLNTAQETAATQHPEGDAPADAEKKKAEALDSTGRALAESISSLDADVLTEAVLEAGSGGVETPEMRERRLESLTNQNRLIAEERRAADLEAKAAAAAKEAAKEARDKARAQARQALEHAALDGGVPGDVDTTPDQRGVADDGPTLSADVSDAEAAPASERQWAAETEAFHRARADESLKTDWTGPIDGNVTERHRTLLKEAVAEADALRAAASELEPESKTLGATDSTLREPLDTIKRKLEVAEFLEMMSHLSALEREKTDLEAIKAKLREGDEPEAAVVQATGDEQHPLKKVVKHRDGKLDALKRRLRRMTSSLEAEIEKVDSNLGDKLHIIDRDNDGVIDVDEFRDAVAAIVRGKHKERDQSSLDDAELAEFVESIMREIDVNEDGVLTVEEVERWHDDLVARRDIAASET